MALAKLTKMSEESLMPTEKALKRNLIGVILFSRDKFEQAIFNFDIALSTSRLDESLTSQIQLNLASSYYKLNVPEKAYYILNSINIDTLKGGERDKFYKLKFKVASELGKDKDVVLSLIHYLGTKQTIGSLKSDPLYEKFYSSF